MNNPAEISPAARVLLRVLGCSPDDLPTLPANAWEISRLANDTDSDLNDMTRLIAKDPPLAARLLKVANSPAFRILVGGEITDLKRAVLVMGFREVADLALGLTILSAIGGGRPLKSRTQLVMLWTHCVAVGLIAELLARDRLGLGKGVYGLGLVHDIGKMALNAFRSKQYDEVLGRLRKGGVQPLEVENQTLLVDHCFVGKALFEYWKMAPSLISAAAWHHQPWQAEKEGDKAGLIALADHLSYRMGYAPYELEPNAPLPEPEPDMADFFKAKGWDPEELLDDELKGKVQVSLEAMDPAGML